jgi:hypothetical protein
MVFTRKSTKTWLVPPFLSHPDTKFHENKLLCPVTVLCSLAPEWRHAKACRTKMGLIDEFDWENVTFLQRLTRVNITLSRNHYFACMAT